MQAVKEYIFSLMIISVSCGAVSMLAPEGSQLKNYIKFLISLIITVVILSPLSSLMGILPELTAVDINIDFFNKDIKTISSVDKIVEETCNLLKEEVKDEIGRKLSVAPIDIEFQCTYGEDEKVIIEKIIVIYDTNNSFLFSDTEKLISELFMKECEVICRYEDDK